MILQILKAVFPFHASAYRVVFVSFDVLCNEPDIAKQEVLIKQWSNSMLAQLQSVGLIGAIMIAAIVGAFSWPALDRLTPITLSLICICWYSSLILSIGAVAVCLQQGVFLARLICAADVGLTIPELLSLSTTGRRRPRPQQVILWQLANGLLETSIYFWLAGFLVFVWASTKVAVTGQNSMDRVVAGCCATTFLVTIAFYLWSMLGLWHRAQKTS